MKKSFVILFLFIPLIGFCKDSTNINISIGIDTCVVNSDTNDTLINKNIIDTTRYKSPDYPSDSNNESILTSFIHSDGYYYFYSAILQGFAALLGVSLVGAVFYYGKINEAIRITLEKTFREKYPPKMDIDQNLKTDYYKTFNELVFGHTKNKEIFCAPKKELYIQLNLRKRLKIMTGFSISSALIVIFISACMMVFRDAQWIKSNITQSSSFFIIVLSLIIYFISAYQLYVNIQYIPKYEPEKGEDNYIIIEYLKNRIQNYKIRDVESKNPTKWFRFKRSILNFFGKANNNFSSEVKKEEKQE